MTLWIIIGSLVGLVAIFLVVMSIRDRKKSKKVKIEQTEIEQVREKSRENIIVYLNLVINENERLLKNFVPSVGKVKMGDIRNGAKKALKSFEKTEEFKYAKDADSNKKLIEVYLKFETENSNTWSKKLELEIKDIKDALKKSDKEFIKTYTPIAKKILKDAYK